MAGIRRWWVVAVWLVLVFSSVPAHASIPLQTTAYKAGSPAPYDSVVPSIDQACLNALAYFNATFGNRFSLVGCSAGSPPQGAQFKRDDGATGYGQSIIVLTGQQICPANSTKVGSSCSCNSGWVENSTSTACVVAPNDCQAQAGQSAGRWTYDGGYGSTANALNSEICKAGTGRRCIVKVPDAKCEQRRLQGVGNPFWWCRGEGFYTGGWGMGAACDRSVASNGDGGSTPTLPPVTVDPVPYPLPPGTAAPTDCPAGTFPGTVNGSPVCAEDVSGPTETKSPQAGTDSKKNPDGSTTTTTTTGVTRCESGACTTTNNTTTNITGNPNSTCPQGTTPSGPNGSASSCTGTSTSSSTKGQSVFCKDNPGSAQCKDGESAFSGSCAGGFICKGDAIQCAMAQEQHRARCDYEKWDAPWKQNGIKDIQASGDISKEFYVNEGSTGNSAWTSWLGSTSVSAACPAGFPMQLLGEQYTLSLKPLCDVGEGARPIVIAVALLLALRTFLSVVTRD